MSAYDSLKAQIATLGDDESKKLMNSLLSEINVEKGKALSDLTDLKKTVTTQKEDMKTLTDIAKAFKDSGVKVENNAQMVELAKQLGSKVDNESSLTEMTKIIEDRESKISEMEKALNQVQVKDKMLPLLNEARKEFKDKEGNLIRVADDFIDIDNLTNVDINQDALVNKKINDVLEIAKKKTEDYNKRNNVDFNGEQTHSLENQESGITNRSTGISKNELKQTFDKTQKTTKDLGDLILMNDLAHEKK